MNNHTHGQLNVYGTPIPKSLCYACCAEQEAATDTVTVKHAEIDGRKIAYTNRTQFLVEVGKGKGAYRSRYTITGNLAQAVMYYRDINIGNGHKKRLVMPSAEKPVLARAWS